MIHGQCSFRMQFWGNKMRNHILCSTPLIALKILNKEGAAVDTVFYLLSICVPDSKNSKNIIFPPRGYGNIYFKFNMAQHVWTSEHSKCLFWPKWSKCPFNPELTKRQMRSKPSQNNIFHGFKSNLNYSETFVNFDQVWPKVDPRWAIKTLILIWLSKPIETNAIIEIIKFPFQWLFTARNRS